MKKESGIHFYINIVNFNQILLDEETKTKKVTHALHALDTFFTSIEKYGKRISPNFVVEKITGARLHMYVVDDVIHAYEVVKKVAAYAYKLSKYVNKEIPKYNMLKDFYINVGVAYGKFYDFEFATNEGYSEITTIGYAANFAAKLQSLSEWGKLSISEDIYEALPLYEQNLYNMVTEGAIKKYKQEKYYTISLGRLNVPISETDLQAARDYANGDNLGDIEFTEIRKSLNFDNLSKTKCKRLEGIPVFADVRGFTAKFEEDDSNLDEMARTTQEILEAMYRVSINHGGIHVQFQGDRELALYHNVPGQVVNGVYEAGCKCFSAAILASMRMIDAVKGFGVHIGVGEDFGTLFATKIGTRGEKDNILLGETVINADTMEDKCAAEDQIAITEEVYKGLQDEDRYLSEQFSKVGNYYVATIGYKDYMRKLSYRQQSINTSRNNYNGAWRDTI